METRRRCERVPGAVRWTKDSHVVSTISVEIAMVHAIVCERRLPTDEEGREDQCGERGSNSHVRLDFERTTCKIQRVPWSARLHAVLSTYEQCNRVGCT